MELPVGTRRDQVAARRGRACCPPGTRTDESTGQIPLSVVGAVALAVLVGLAVYLAAGRGGGSGAIATLETADFHALAFSPSDPTVVFFGHHNGLMRSDDGGRSWHPLVERRNFDAMGLAVSPARPEVVLAIAVKDRRGLVFRSEDGGATWGGHR